MSRDRIDELAATLFAAAREEAPERSLLDRVQRSTARDAQPLRDALPLRVAAEPFDVTLAGDAGRPRSSGRRVLGGVIGNEAGAAHADPRAAGPYASGWLARGLLAAIVCGGVAALLLWPGQRDSVTLSAERSPGATLSPGARLSPKRPASGAALAEAEPAAGDSSRPIAEEAPSPRSASAAAPPHPDNADGERGAPVAPATATTAGQAAGAASPPPLGGRPGGDRAAGTTSDPTRTPAAGTTSHPAQTPAAGTTSADPTPPGAGRAAPAPLPTRTLANELGMLKQIRQALRAGDGASAIALLDRHASGEVGTNLSLEASVLRVEALDAVGRRADAEALARRFVRDNPDSPLAERAQRYIDRAAAGPAAKPAPESAP